MPIENTKRKTAQKISITTLLIAMPVLLFFISFLIGRFPLSPSEVIIALSSIFLPDQNIDPVILSIVWEIRLPRIIAAMIVGAALSISGASFQGTFQNPLVSPDILGVASGAGFGAALAILLDGSPFFVQLSAFVFGLLAVGLTHTISQSFRGSRILIIVLCGIAIGSLFGALISISKYVADPHDQLPSIVFWLMGSVSKVSIDDLYPVIIPIIIGFPVLILIRWRLNILALGDEEAQSLGIDVKRLRIMIILCCTLLTSSAVSISGTIGWVGLVIPHVTRMIVGPDHKKLLPATICVGAFFMLLVDNLARSLIIIEIPLGILTSLVGVPFFLYLIKKRNEGWS
ncbi:MAG: iron ABC transporter permease [Methanobacteriaceae archaeon]|jgi:iron complex transport system permease protein